MIDSQKLAVFVPVDTTVPIATVVVRGSAIVGRTSSNEVERVKVYYEGNLFGYANIKTLADRARVAAGRLLDNAPTISLMTVPKRELHQVGWFDSEAGILLLDDERAQEALASWLGVEEIDPKELQFSAL